VSTTLTPTPASAPLTAADRCDRCGAQARVRVIMPGGGDLLFCGHHGKQYSEQLRKVAISYVDQTESVQDELKNIRD